MPSGASPDPPAPAPFRSTTRAYGVSVRLRAKAYAVELVYPQPSVGAASPAVIPLSRVHGVDADDLAVCGRSAETMFDLRLTWDSVDSGLKCPRCDQAAPIPAQS